MLRRTVRGNGTAENGLVPKVHASFILHVDSRAGVAKTTNVTPDSRFDVVFLLDAQVVRIEEDEVVVADPVRQLESMQLVPDGLGDGPRAEIPRGKGEPARALHNRDDVR